MRAVLLILILAVVAALVAMWAGLFSVNQTREARPPQIAAGENGVAAKGGQAPAYEVETGSVTVGTGQANVSVPVPKVQVNRPADKQQQAQQPAQPANAQ